MCESGLRRVHTRKGKTSSRQDRHTWGQGKEVCRCLCVHVRGGPGSKLEPPSLASLPFFLVLVSRGPPDELTLSLDGWEAIPHPRSRSSPSDPHRGHRSQSRWGPLGHRYWKFAGNHWRNPLPGSYPAMATGNRMKQTGNEGPSRRGWGLLCSLQWLRKHLGARQQLWGQKDLSSKLGSIPAEGVILGESRWQMQVLSSVKVGQGLPGRAVVWIRGNHVVWHHEAWCTSGVQNMLLT